jgi:hypothetical protein
MAYPAVYLSLAGARPGTRQRNPVSALETGFQDAEEVISDL